MIDRNSDFVTYPQNSHTTDKEFIDRETKRKREYNEVCSSKNEHFRSVIIHGGRDFRDPLTKHKTQINDRPSLSEILKNKIKNFINRILS